MIIEKHDHDVGGYHYRDSFNLLFDQIEDCLFIMDETGRIIRANKAALEKLEYTLEEMISLNIELLDPLACSIPLCTKYGKQIPVETRVFKGMWEGNDVLFGISKEVHLGATNDNAEQVQLEMELANHKIVLKTMLDTIPDYIFVKDIHSAYIGCNKAYAEKYLGVKEDEVIGKTDFDFFKDIELVEFYRNQDQKAFETSEPLKYEGQYVLIDGSVIDTETVKTHFLDEQGNVAGLIGIARNITNRKRLARKLKEQAEYAELLFRTVPSAVLSVDKRGKIIRWNKIAEEITGYAEEEAMGEECSRILHGIDRADCGLCSKVSDSLLIDEKCKIVTKNGQIRHVLKSIAVLKDEFGVISEKMECFEDITEMIEMEAELRESKEGYAAIVNNAPQIVVIFKEGIIKFVNDAGKDSLGYKEEDYIGRHIKGFLTKKSFTYLDSELSNEINGEYCVSCEIELVKKSGEIIYVLFKGTDITFEREKATLAVMMDITEGKLLNVRLRESEDKFRQVAETINEIFLITDNERIVFVSPAYERITGSPSQALLDNPHALADLIYPLDRVRLQASFPRDFLSMHRTTNEEFRIIRPDGEMRWLWLQSYPVRDDADNGSLKATTIVDITDRKEIEDKLREREQETQRELVLAAQVQRDSLPLPFAGNKVRVSTVFEPYSMVSGDFYNYRWIEEQNKLCGYIIDVSGHGVATALQTATFKMMLDTILLTGKTIKEGHLQTINQRIKHYLYEDSFVALLYFEFDLQAKVLKLISAGITLFLTANPQGCSLVPISGCYLGIVDDPEIETEIIPLNAGEIYCLMSDGVSDLIELYGVSRQGSFMEYKNWFEKLAKCSDRNDDFSVICIEILQGDKETNVLDIKNDKELERARVIISEFLVLNAPIIAPMLEVAINEAMNNGLYAGGRVLVKTGRVGDKLIIRVKDDGPGFNTKRYKDKLKKERYEEEFDELLEAEGGRGIFLMGLFFDRVIYNTKGNEVLLMKKI